MQHISLTLHVINFYSLIFILNIIMPSWSSCAIRLALNYHYLYLYWTAT